MWSTQGAFHSMQLLIYFQSAQDDMLTYYSFFPLIFKQLSKKSRR